MNNQSSIYCQSMASESEQNRQVILLMLLSKFMLVVLLGAVYTGIRLFG